MALADKPTGLNSIVVYATMPDIFAIAKDTPETWARRRRLPKPRGEFVSHKYWTVKDLLIWAKETGRTHLIRPEWQTGEAGEFISSLSEDEGHYEP